ncbi:MAG: hypothetical protein HZB35_06780 [Nitrospirae bacterium]|nr:hypothetical protein [Nitrospirota bacterium]
MSQQKRKRVEEIFGWWKTVGLLRKVKLRGVQRVGWLFTLAAAVDHLVRMRNFVARRGRWRQGATSRRRGVAGHVVSIWDPSGSFNQRFSAAR